MKWRMAVGYSLEMVCGAGGRKRLTIHLRDDTSWQVRHASDGVTLVCQIDPPKKSPVTGDIVEEFCLCIPRALLEQLGRAASRGNDG